MDMSTDLRSRMAAQRISVADVAELVGRTSTQVSRYRSGESEIPREVWLILLDRELLSGDSILGRPVAGDAAGAGPAAQGASEPAA